MQLRHMIAIRSKHNYQTQTVATYGPTQIGTDDVLGSFWNTTGSPVTWSFTYEATMGQGITIGFSSEWLNAGFNTYSETTTQQTATVSVPAYKTAQAVRGLYQKLSHIRLTRVDVYWCRTHNTYEEIRTSAGEEDYKDLWISIVINTYSFSPSSVQPAATNETSG